jgi:hypothetical protein
MYAELITAPDCSVELEEFDRLMELDKDVNFAWAVAVVGAIVFV